MSKYLPANENIHDQLNNEVHYYANIEFRITKYKKHKAPLCLVFYQNFIRLRQMYLPGKKVKIQVVFNHLFLLNHLLMIYELVPYL
jgi:hypothetical protein